MSHAHPIADPTRRALLAALAGGLAAVGPASGAGKKGKKKPKPPLAAALIQIGPVGTTADEFFSVGYGYHAVDLRPDGVPPIDGAFVALFPGGTAEQMRAGLAEEVGTEVGRQFGVAADRVAVLVV